MTNRTPEILKRIARGVGAEGALRSLRSRARVAVSLVRPSAYPLHRKEDIEPFFIVGSGRCGTTLRRRLLQASPQIHIPPENWALGPCIHLFRRYRWTMPWRDMVHLLLGRHVHQGDRWFSAPPVALRKELLDVDPEDRSLASFLDAVYRFHGRSQGAVFERWGDKTPLNVEFMDGILTVFPRAKFIHLLRDGVDVCYSYLKRAEHAHDLPRSAGRWKGAVTKAQSFGAEHPDHLMEVRYETMVGNPQATLERVFHFLGLTFDAEMLGTTDHFDEMSEAQSVSHYRNAFRPISTDSIGKGRSNLTEAQKKELIPLINEHLVRFGYRALH